MKELTVSEYLKNLAEWFKIYEKWYSENTNQSGNPEAADDGGGSNPKTPPPPPPGT